MANILTAEVRLRIIPLWCRDASSASELTHWLWGKQSRRMDLRNRNSRVSAAWVWLAADDPGGFVEGREVKGEEDCFAFSIAEQDHWKWSIVLPRKCIAQKNGHRGHSRNDRSLQRIALRCPRRLRYDATHPQADFDAFALHL